MKMIPLTEELLSIRDRLLRIDITTSHLTPHEQRAARLIEDSYELGVRLQNEFYRVRYSFDLSIPIPEGQSRISADDVLIGYTKLVAQRGTCLRAKVGCVIALETRPLSEGYNGSLPGEPHCTDVGCLMENGHCVRTIHAEANAVSWAAKRGIPLAGSTLFTYGWKDGICDRCRKIAVSAGVIKIIEIPLEEK
jgi:dCMP deaminase